MEWIRRQRDLAMFLRGDQDYFHFLYPFRVIAGYPVRLDSTRAKVGMAIRLVVYTVYLLTTLHKLTYSLYRPEDSNYLVLVDGITGLLLGYLILLVFGVRYHHYFVALKGFFNDRSFARDHPAAGAIRQRCYRWTNFLILLPQAGILLHHAQMTISRHCERRHMQLVIRGEPVESPLINELYCTILYIPSVGFFMACALVSSYLMGVLGEMNLLATCLGELDDTVARQLADQGGERAPRKCFWKAYRAELRRCAVRHCEIFSMLAKVRHFSSLVFLLHHGVSLTIMVAAAYVMLREHAARENLVLFEYPIPLMLLYFTLCHLVEKIQDMNNMIGERLYGTQWMLQLRYSAEFDHEYRSAVRTIQLLLWNSQQRIRFTCGSINEISMAKFTELLNLTYTIVMFFISVN